MEVKLVEERKNPLLHRTEYRFEVAHGAAATPSRNDVRQELSKLLKVPRDRLVLEWMRARFGVAKSEGFAIGYDTKEALDVTAREHILVRNGLRERKAAKPPAEPTAPPVALSVETPPSAPAKKE